MIYDLLTLEAYFAQFKGLFGIADYVFGNTEDILNRKAKVIRYPCLWVELFDEDVDLNDHSDFNIRLVLQKNGGNIPRTQDRVILNELRNILRQVAGVIQNDSPQKLIYRNQKLKFQFKERFADDDELLVLLDITIGGITVCS